MDLNRRGFAIGAGCAFALVGAGAAWKVTQMPQTGIAPWTLDATPPADVRLDAFRHAILAPNPHNRQPWLIELIGTNSAILRCDPAKRLPETDPFDRQITIGFGTFCELARIAAAERGVRIDIIPFPEGEPQPRLDARPVARLEFVADPSVTRDPLFRAIVERRTNRSIYAAPPSPAQLAALMQADIDLTTDPALLAKLRGITVAAIATETQTPRTHGESVRLMRIGYAEIDATPDGLFLAGPMIEATSAIGMTTRASIADPASSAFAIGLDGLRDTYGSVPSACWITTPGNTRSDQLDAGRRYARLTLSAAREGVAIHPMSQALQEYPEMAGYFRQVHQLLGISAGARLQMLVRAGLAPQVPPAARWPLAKHLIA